MENQKMTQQVTNNRAVFVWETPELGSQRSSEWYVIAFAVVLFFVLYGIFTGSASMAIAFIVLAGVYYMAQLKRAPGIHVVVSELGIHFGSRFYPYNTIQSFWIVYHPPQVSTLNFKVIKGVSRTMTIELDPEINPGAIREYLLTQIAELEGVQESLTDKIVRKLKL